MPRGRYVEGPALGVHLETDLTQAADHPGQEQLAAVRDLHLDPPIRLCVQTIHSCSRSDEVGHETHEKAARAGQPC